MGPILKKISWTVLMGLSFAGFMFINPGCKSNEDCDLAGAVERGMPRQEVIRSWLVLRQQAGEWKPEKILKVRKWANHSDHRAAFGTVSLHSSTRGRTSRALLEASSEGPALLESVFPQSQPELLEGSTFALQLPDVSEDDQGALKALQSAQIVRWAPVGSLRVRSLEFNISGLKTEELATEPARYETPEGFSSSLPIEVVHWSGDPRNRLNLIILADGYLEKDMPTFKKNVQEMVDQLFSKHQPYSDYKNMINVIRMDVPSDEAGAWCDDAEYSIRSNRYGSAFPIACLNAAIGTQFNDRFIYQMNLARVLKESNAVYFKGVSVTDETYVLVHSPKYGGAAVFWGTQTDVSGWDVASHEMGHAWGNLADEYVVEGDPCNIFMAFAANSSFKTSRKHLKWNNWVLNSTPVPTPNEAAYDGLIGLFQGGAGGCNDVLYRPSRKCKMISSSRAFCSVCLEQMILRIYDRINPIEAGLVREGNSVTAKVTEGQKMRTRWYVDGGLVQDTVDYQPLTELDSGSHLVQMVVFEEQAPVRRDRCNLVFSAKQQF